MQRFVSMIALSLLVGCTYQQGSRVGDPPPPAEVEPQFVAVLSEGVTIFAEDGSWSIGDGDDPLPPPFRTDSLRLTLGSGLQALEAQGVIRVPGRHVTLDELLDLSGDFMAAGARRVRVQVPGREKALFGVLALTPAIKDTPDSSAKRAYRVMVPQVRVQQALGAQIALVCQPYRARIPVVKGLTVGTTDPFAANPYMTNEYVDSQEFECVTWILWISDAPFAGHDPSWTAPPR